MEQNKQLEYDYSPLATDIGLMQTVRNIPNSINTASKPIKFLAIVATLIILSDLVMILVALVASVTQGQANFSLLLGLISPIFIILMSTIITVQTSKTQQRNIHKRKFAEINNIGFILNQPNPSYNGLIFSQNYSSSKITEAYLLNNTQNTEIGNYTYTKGDGKNSETHFYGYIKITLPRRLPHMLLDARRNNGIANSATLPLNFDRDQKLQLEGDFNNYFTVYAPQNYEQDALYVLTPDVMQVLVTYFKDYDIELVDDTLFVYCTKFFKLDSEEELKYIFSSTNLLYIEIYKQSGSYKDDNIAQNNENIIAAQGSRLKKSSPLVVVLLCIAAILIVTVIFWRFLPNKGMAPVITFGISAVAYSFYRILK